VKIVHFFDFGPVSAGVFVIVPAECLRGFAFGRIPVRNKAEEKILFLVNSSFVYLSGKRGKNIFKRVIHYSNFFKKNKDRRFLPFLAC
jgi:hypothetical protein